MYKILALANDNYGCGKFRTFDPFKCIAENFADEFEVKTMLTNQLPQTINEFKELFKNFDMLHFHKALDTNLQILSIAKEMGLVTVVDVDDHWNLGDYHPLSNTAKRENWAKPVIEHLKNADYVTTTTEYLANEVKKYNKNVFVIPNAVNPDEEQFKEHKIKSDKIRFGVICGSSHLNDLREMEGFIKQIPKETLDKCQFVLCGFDTNGKMTIYDRQTNTYRQVPINPEETVWSDYEKIMTDNYSIVSDNTKKWLKQFIPIPYCGDENYLRCWTKDINTYATHYDFIDVLLVPLKECQFNLSKCVVGTTKVSTNNGIFKIEDLFNNELKYNVFVKKDSKKIKNFFKSENIPTLQIKTEKGYCIECTEQHKLIKNNEWIEASSLKIGDEIKMESPKLPNKPYVILDNITLDEDMSYILGYMYGYYNLNKKGLSLSNVSSQLKKEDLIYDILDKKGLITDKIKAQSENDVVKSCYGFKNCAIKKAFRFLSNKYKEFTLDKTSTIPNEIFQSNTKCVTKFIDGFTDGNMNDNIFVFKNKRILSDFQYLLLTIYKTSTIISDKQLKIDDSSLCSIDNINFTDKISSITKSVKTVYDIEVEDIHMYNGNGFISHNSQLKVIEAGFKHKAIIAEEVGPYKIDLKPLIKKGGEIDDTGNALLVNPSKTHKQWSKYITYLVNNKDKIELLQNNLYETVKDKYNLLNVTKERIKVYKEILKNKNK